MARLPVEHARGPGGGALCNATRKWGALIAQTPDGVTCKKCRKRIEAGIASSETVTWFDQPEFFTFLSFQWDVRAAKAIIREAPRLIQRVNVADLRPFLSRAARIQVDPARASDPSVDLTVPLVAVTTAQGSGLPIDGWHRVAKAIHAGVADLPIVFLTETESEAVRVV